MQLLFGLSNAEVKSLELEVAIRNHDPKIFTGGNPLERRKGLVGPKAPSFDLLSLRRDDPARVFVDDVLCLSTGQFGYDDAIALVHHQLVCLDLLQM